MVLRIIFVYYDLAKVYYNFKYLSLARPNVIYQKD